MSTEYPVVIYGASGYTGKQIAGHLALAGIPFIAAGRSQSRLESEMAKVPELRHGAAFKCQAVEHSFDALTQLFAGRKIVYNVTGPFMELGEPVIRAALKARCHYLDTTGEQDWVIKLRDEYGAAFANADLALLPSLSFMWAAGNIAAEIALETPGIDTLELLYVGDSAVSIASAKSFLRMCTYRQYFLRHGKLEMWPYATPSQVHFPDSFVVASALPWTGASEQVWYQGDPRVRNCSVQVGFRNPAMISAVLTLLREFEQKYRNLPADEQIAITNRLGAQLAGVEPERERPEDHRSLIGCIGRGDVSGVSVTLRGNSPYAQTAAFAVEACRRILSNQLLAPGFVSPAKAIGARRLMNAIAELGYHTSEVQRI